MVPAPYLALKQKATIVIEPWQVLLASKRSKIFIRAYTEVFIE